MKSYSRNPWAHSPMAASSVQHKRRHVSVTHYTCTRFTHTSYKNTYIQCDSWRWLCSQFRNVISIFFLFKKLISFYSLVWMSDRRHSTPDSLKGAHHVAHTKNAWHSISISSVASFLMLAEFTRRRLRQCGGSERLPFSIWRICGGVLR